MITASSTRGDAITECASLALDRPRSERKVARDSHARGPMRQQSFESQRGFDNVAANAPVDARGAFIIRTYVHLVGAIFAFVALTAAILQTPLPEQMMRALASSRYSWLVVMAAFVGAGWMAQRLARSEASAALQYAGLALFVVAEAVIFIPLLFIAVHYSTPDVLPTAALITLVLFGGLTGVVFITRKDFSFMKGILGVATLGAIGIIVASIIFGFSLGIVFSGAMVLLAGGYVLYRTSNVLHHYRTDQHVAAALELFAAVALLFWYVLQILMSRGRR